jgi:hypothetical protein
VEYYVQKAFKLGYEVIGNGIPCDCKLKDMRRDKEEVLNMFLGVPRSKNQAL